MYTGGAGGGARGASGAIGRMGGQGRVTRQGWGKGLWGGGGGGGVCLCGRVRSGIFFDISRRYCIVFVYFFILCCLLPKALISLFHFSGLWILKNNTSCCECTSNNQTSIVLLCHNVQFIYLYIYSGKNEKKSSAEYFHPTTPETRKRRNKKYHSRLLWSYRSPPLPCSVAWFWGKTVLTWTLDLCPVSVKTLRCMHSKWSRSALLRLLGLFLKNKNVPAL